MNENRGTIIIGSDHAAVSLKNRVKDYLETGLHLQVEDIGPFDETSVDYPDYGIRVARAVSRGEYDRGILLCGTGLGMSMTANRFPGVRAALCSDLFSAALSRRHNDANILVMGGRMIGDILAFEIVKTWWETPYEGGRHQRRLDKFDQLGATE